MLTSRDLKMLEFIEEYEGLTINQASKIFFKGKYSKDMARKRLKILADNKILKYSTVWSCKERIYYKATNTMTAHKKILIDFYAEMISHGAEVLEFKKEVKYMEGTLRSDGFMYIKYKNRKFIMFIEVDFTHSTDISKYELLCHTNELQDEWGVFPKLIIITEHEKKYRSNEFLIQTLNHNLENFTSILP